jgi:hypothetical protein
MTGGKGKKNILPIAEGAEGYRVEKYGEGRARGRKGLLRLG